MSLNNPTRRRTIFMDSRREYSGSSMTDAERLQSLEEKIQPFMSMEVEDASSGARVLIARNTLIPREDAN